MILSLAQISEEQLPVHLTSLGCINHLLPLPAPDFNPCWSHHNTALVCQQKGHGLPCLVRCIANKATVSVTKAVTSKELGSYFTFCYVFHNQFAIFTKLNCEFFSDSLRSKSLSCWACLQQTQIPADCLNCDPSTGKLLHLLMFCLHKKLHILESELPDVIKPTTSSPLRIHPTQSQ